MLSLHVLREVQSNVTAVLFKKESYMFEGILRWLMDRGFVCENFEETESCYVFKQPAGEKFRSYSYHLVDGRDIAVEVGEDKVGDITVPGNYPDISTLL